MQPPPTPFKVVSRVYYNREVTNHKIEKLVKQIVKNILDKIPFGYTDIIGKVAASPNEHAEIKTVN